MVEEEELKLLRQSREKRLAGSIESSLGCSSGFCASMGY